jgi:asparagine synthase (glutamine-hydrolysing)
MSGSAGKPRKLSAEPQARLETARSETQPVPAATTAVDVAIDEERGWRRHQSGQVTLWFKGWMPALDGASLAARLATGHIKASPAALGELLLGAGGHYAIVATGPGWALAAVDWIRSIPLAACRIGKRWAIDDQPERLRKRAGLTRKDIDPDAALAIATAGYAIDAASLYKGIELLVPGELMWLDAAGTATRHRYHIYRPWNVARGEARNRVEELRERTLAIVEQMIASLAGRPLLVPLSAGRDSRLVASAARHLGYKNVRCFTYGRSGNFESVTSKAVAERLGYPWAFVPLTTGKARRFFAGDDYARYLDFADSGAAVPFVQDMLPLLELKANGFAPADAVIVNGNSGDYITGGHVLAPLQEPAAAGTSDAERWRRILDTILKKHFRLWQALARPAVSARIKELLRLSIARAGGQLQAPEADHGLYEYAEFQDRQCKYVVGGQRIYEFLGHDWRLPLWDNDYLRFWEGASLAEKTGQSLFARMLDEANWGGVWDGIPVNAKSVRPLWLVPIRLAAKGLHAPLGAERWHRFERRYFQYWMDATCTAACVPYGMAIRDTRGARHHISWLAEIYLARHDLSLDEAVGLTTC